MIGGDTKQNDHSLTLLGIYTEVDARLVSSVLHRKLYAIEAGHACISISVRNTRLFLELFHGPVFVLSRRLDDLKYADIVIQTLQNTNENSA